MTSLHNWSYIWDRLCSLWFRWWSRKKYFWTLCTVFQYFP